ncbi:hypothetical protein BD626DRAFT_569932 [Schizophyllum amplum]|uniref:Uncharacterized protein n=1 Tax=Schizophyllum amplum TaxID=97359 RepID=A0A550CBZ4_9AGAR|nr:hypothetical protein BD626DRAFT_569932 [Auriculariopsis ampla]
MSSSASLQNLHRMLHLQAEDDFWRRHIQYLGLSWDATLRPNTGWDDDEHGEAWQKDGVPLDLSFIGRVIPETANLAPDGNWPHSRAGGCFLDTSIAFHIGHALPCHEPFRTESIRCHDQLKRIMDAITMGDGLPIKQGIFRSSCFAIQHHVFEKKLFHTQRTCSPRASLTQITQPSSTVEHELPWMDIQNWPTTTTQASSALQSIAATHRVRPLPVYDEDARILSPAEYELALPGALVNVLFTLRHFNHAGDGHYFVWELKKLFIIQRGPIPYASLPLPIRSKYALPQWYVFVALSHYPSSHGMNRHSNEEEDVAADVDIDFPAHVLPP